MRIESKRRERDNGGKEIEKRRGETRKNNDIVRRRE
jgi:hypothetical protein